MEKKPFNQREGYNIFVTALATVLAAFLTVLVTLFIDNQKHNSAKLDDIWRAVIEQPYIDSLQNIKITNITLNNEERERQHRIETDETILEMLNSLKQAKIQLLSSDITKNRKSNEELIEKN